MRCARGSSLMLMSVVALILGLTATGAGAATLFTTSARTTPVTVGATGTLSSGGTLTFTLGTGPAQWCEASTLDFALAQNSVGTVRGTVTGGHFTGCSPTSFHGTFPWTVTVSGTGYRTGTTSNFPSSTVSGFAAHFQNGLYTGTLSDASLGTPPTRGVFASQSTTAGSPVCLNLDRAFALTGQLGALNVDGSYCFTGEPASTWSLEQGDPPTTTTTTAATLYTTSAHTASVSVGATTSLASTGTVSFTSSGVTYNTCESSTLSLGVDQNTAGVVRASVTSASFLGCIFATTPTLAPNWAFTLRGTGIISGTSVAFAGATLSNVALHIPGLLGQYTGAFNDARPGIAPLGGVSVRQTTGSPLCVVMDQAEGLTGPMSGDLRLTGTYCAESHPGTTWSLPNAP